MIKSAKIMLTAFAFSFLIGILAFNLAHASKGVVLIENGQLRVIVTPTEGEDPDTAITMGCVMGIQKFMFVMGVVLTEHEAMDAYVRCVADSREGVTGGQGIESNYINARGQHDGTSI